MTGPMRVEAYLFLFQTAQHLAPLRVFKMQIRSPINLLYRGPRCVREREFSRLLSFLLPIYAFKSYRYLSESSSPETSLFPMSERCQAE